MKIKKLELAKIYNKYTQNFKFNDKFNYIIGINGSGKSTALNILDNFIKGNLNYFFELDFEDFFITFEFNKDLVQLGLIKAMNEDTGELELAYCVPKVNGKSLTEEEGYGWEEYYLKAKQYRNKCLALGLEREFDEEKIKEYFNEYNSDKNRSVKETLLDFLPPIEKIEELLSNVGNNFATSYLEIMSKLLNNEEELESSSKDIENLKLAIENIDKTLNISNYISAVNLFFEETNKVMNFDRKTGHFKITYKNDDSAINLRNLSTGEKQLMVLLSNVAFSKKKDYVILLDQPEDALHMSWQEKLFPALKKVTNGKNIQFITATHSPEITGDATEDEFICLEPFYVKNTQSFEDGGNA